ncbi:MAG: DUF3987 domain-containing protein [Phycisphaerae bacterium]|nr:DUF3987 domain-containing protein [Phycisphaerae bacterium]
MPTNGTSQRQTPRPTAPVKPIKAYATHTAALVAYRLGEPSIIWTYENSAGDLVGAVGRWNTPGGKQVRPVALTPNGWICAAMPAPRVLYNLVVVRDTDDPVFIVEGEKCADAARELGLVATTSAGGAKAASKANWSPLAGRQVIVMPDNDDPGEAYAADVARLLFELDPPAVVRILRLPDLPDHGDLVDHIEANPNTTADDLRRMAEAAPVVEVAQGSPAEAHVERSIPGSETTIAPSDSPPAWVPFPIDALPDPVAFFVEEVAGCTGTDPAFAALGCLACAAGAVGNRAAAIVLQGWTEPAVLWGAIIGRSGTTKSPVLKLVTRPFFDLHKDAQSQHAEAMVAYERDRDRYELALADWKRDAKAGEVKDKPLEPIRPAEKRVMVSDVTVEKLAVLLNENPRGLVVVRDELASWLGSFDRYSQGKGADMPAWLSMYDASSVVVDRKTSGSVFVERAAVSVLGSIQPRTLRRLFGNAERESGLLGRFCLVEPPEQLGLWSDKSLSETAADGWRSTIEGLIGLPPALGDDGTERPQYLPLHRDALPDFVPWHDALKRELASEEDEDLRAAIAKLKGTCIRIALVLACIEAAHGERVVCIGRESIRRAIEIVDWLKHEARRVYAGLKADGAAEHPVVDWLRRRGGAGAVRELVHGLRAYRTNTPAAQAALDDLKARGMGDWVHLPSGPQGGSPSRVFRLKAAEASHATPVFDPVAGGYGDGDAGDAEKNASAEPAVDDDDLPPPEIRFAGLDEAAAAEHEHGDAPPATRPKSRGIGVQLAAEAIAVLKEMSMPNTTRDHAFKAVADWIRAGGKNGDTTTGYPVADEAVACLRRIPVKDALRQRGFEIVNDWIEYNE